MPVRSMCSLLVQYLLAAAKKHRTKHLYAKFIQMNFGRIQTFLSSACEHYLSYSPS